MAAVHYTVCVGLILAILPVPWVSGERLLMLMVGGFSCKYLDDFQDDLEGFKLFSSIGSRAECVDPVFPASTFPNHYSLVTGLYPENHGFVGDSMWDEENNETFNMGVGVHDTNTHWWQEAEPIWITAIRQGKRAYLYNWFGCNVKIHGKVATFCEKYSGTPNVRDGMTDFLRQSEDAVNALVNNKAELAGVYTEIVKESRHQFKTDGVEMKGVLKWIDNEFIRIYYKLEDAGLLDDVNVIIFSDHGMTEISSKRTIDLRNLVSENDYDVIEEFGPKASVWPKEGKIEEVYQKLKDSSKHATVYKKADIPEDWHYKNHKHVAPLTVVAEPGWMILTPKNRFPLSKLGSELVAYHGFSKSSSWMKAIFVGVGPNFKKGTISTSFAAVNVFQLMCKILRIKPTANNGTWEAVHEIFEETAEPTFWNSKVNIAVVVSVCVAAVGLNMLYRRRVHKYV